MNPTAVVRPLPGPGLAARSGDLLLVCADAGAGHATGVEQLLGLITEVAAAGGDGSVLVRRVAAVLAADFDNTYPACAAAGPTADGRVAVLVHGAATAEVNGGDGAVSLSAADAIGSVTRLVPGPVKAVRLLLPGAGEANPRVRLDGGIVPAAGLQHSDDDAWPRLSTVDPMPPGYYPPPPADLAPPSYLLAFDSIMDSDGSDSAEPVAAQEAHEAHHGELGVPDWAAPVASAYGGDEPLAPVSDWPAPPPVPVPKPSDFGEMLPSESAWSVPPRFDSAPAEAPPFVPDWRAVTPPAVHQIGEHGEPVVVVPALPSMRVPSPPDAVAPPMRHPDPNAPFVSVVLTGQEDVAVEPPPATPDQRPMVLGAYCLNGHFTDPGASVCGVCGVGMDLSAIKQEGPRPPLGVLRLDDGSVFRLDVDYVVGREPQADPEVAGGTARPLRVIDADGIVSRRHLRIMLVGWNVQVMDLGSANGTTVVFPDETERITLQPNRPLLLRPGTQISMGRRWLRFESHHAA
jgi:FHA domain